MNTLFVSVTPVVWLHFRVSFEVVEVVCRSVSPEEIFRVQGNRFSDSVEPSPATTVVVSVNKSFVTNSPSKSLFHWRVNCSQLTSSFDTASFSFFKAHFIVAFRNVEQSESW